MKTTQGLMLIILTSSCALMGFTSGLPSRNDAGASTDAAPVTVYEEPRVPERPPAQRYQQLHAMIVASLEEAAARIDADYSRAVRLTADASRFVRLLAEMVGEDQRRAFDDVAVALNSCEQTLRKKRLARSAQRDVKAQLLQAAETVNNDFSFARASSWIHSR